MTVQVRAEGPSRRNARRRRRIGEHLWAYGLLAPVIVILGVFKIFPVFYAFYISLFRWDIIQGAFRGLGNYGDILYENPTRAEAFWRSLSTTFTYGLFTVPLEMGLALVVAFLLFGKLRGRGVYRTLYYLPYVTSTVAAAVIFNWLFHPQYGIANAILGLVGVGPQKWYDEPRGLFELAASAAGVALPDWAAGPSLALVGMCAFSIWHYFGYQVIIFLAGLGNISNGYYEAARLDGASERQLFRLITLPLLSPTTFFVFTIATIGVLREFNAFYILTNGGPLDTTRTTGLLVFKTFYQQGQLGLGSAVAFLLALVILAFTLTQQRVLASRVTYE